MHLCNAAWLLCALVACTSGGNREPRRGAEVAIFDESERPRLQDPLPTRSAIFDGRKVTLQAVPGETLGVLAVATKPVAFSIELEAKGVETEAFAVGWAAVVEPSTSMFGPSRGPGNYADELTPRTAPVAGRAAFFDVRVGKSTQPGSYTGVLNVGEQHFPIRLAVHGGAIDLHESPLVWAFFIEKEVVNAHPDDAGIVAKYVTMFRDHGVVLAGDLVAETWQEKAPFLIAFSASSL